MSEPNKLPKGGVSETPSETTSESPLTSPVDVGQLSGGQVQQFLSETLASKAKREAGR
jgi:hypothetical protein